MNNQEKMLVAITVALIVMAVYITFVQPSQPVVDETGHARDLLNTAIAVGGGQDEYYYSFKETSDGYPVEYVLFIKDGKKMIGISNPFADKEIYYLENDTILCEHFAGIDICSSVKNNTDPYFVNYINSLETLFFDDFYISQRKQKMDFLFEEGHAVMSPDVEVKTINGKTCEEINYLIDYSTLSVVNANRYGIAAGLGKENWTMCVDSAAGLAYYQSASYSYLGMPHEFYIELLEADWNPADMTVPENLTEGAYGVLLEEKGWQAQYQDCEAYQGETKDNCITDIATILKSKKICELAGSWRDKCLLIVVSLKPDESICTTIEDSSIVDDCYLEMAYATKDSGYCSKIVDSAKQEDCINEASVEPPVQNITENESVGIANPAAVNCADKEYGYELRVDIETNGTYGVCIYEGLECDEWALFRQECCLTDADCDSGNCTGQVCIGIDMEEFMNQIDNRTSANQTNTTESP